MSSLDLFNCLNGSVRAPTKTETAAFVEKMIEAGPTAWQCHPLGFFVAREQIDDGLELRLHVWPSDWRIPESQEGADVHDHIFNLTSVILLGAVSNETFEIVAGPSGRYRVIRIGYSAQSSESEETQSGNFSLVSKGMSTMSVGEVYRMPAGVLHRGSTDTTPAVTVVATRRIASVPFPRVVLPNHLSLPTPFERRAPTEPEWQEIMGTLAPIRR